MHLHKIAGGILLLLMGARALPLAEVTDQYAQCKQNQASEHDLSKRNDVIIWPALCGTAVFGFCFWKCYLAPRNRDQVRQMRQQIQAALQQEQAEAQQVQQAAQLAAQQEAAAAQQQAAAEARQMQAAIEFTRSPNPSPSPDHINTPLINTPIDDPYPQPHHVLMQYPQIAPQPAAPNQVEDPPVPNLVADMV